LGALHLLFRVCSRELATSFSGCFFAKTILWQKRAARRRAALEKDGLHVPPIAIFSITNRCNLRCKGCYAQAIRAEEADELSFDQMRGIICETEALGVSLFVIAGGEPLTRPEILDIARDHSHIIFLLVTNGLLLDEALIQRLVGMRNVVPVLSIEGNQTETDERRGSGVYDRLQVTMQQMKRAGIFFSLSLTVTRTNFDTITDSQFIGASVAAGCKLFLLLEYTPIREGTDEWVITDLQRKSIQAMVATFRAKFPALFVAVPWDEEAQGGCLGSGRGFVHISATGDLEPCPFAPYSDTNLLDVPFKRALQSRFLRLLRENHELFSETTDGCALWKSQQAVRTLLAQKAAVPTEATGVGRQRI
jgi:MoaA/NifB/PqqE/SkfB family radical SAM enzyme